MVGRYSVFRRLLCSPNAGKFETVCDVATFHHRICNGFDDGLIWEKVKALYGDRK